MGCNWNSQTSQPLDVSVLCDITALNRITKIMQNFCNAAHPDAPYSGKMQLPYISWHCFHNLVLVAEALMFSITLASFCVASGSPILAELIEAALNKVGVDK